ncbi:MAG TPA: peptide deformylase [Candidatus Omnitrophica bacterium]|nr:peptide deformylase [Candidatus Omnitrophota bacterium]
MLQTKLKLRFYGDPVLRRRSAAVAEVTDKERDILNEMAEVMRISGGIGLAAPQVGINKQMVLVDVGQGPVILINPRIIKRSGSSSLEEGCLSLPGVYVKVKRAKTVQVSGLNEKNQKIKICAYDLLARALQHEIDHLRGRLIIDHAGFLQKIKLRKKLRSLDKIVFSTGMV